MKLIKRSVTYAVKSFVYQCLVHGRGHFHKKTEKSGTRPWTKTIECKHLTFSFRHVNTLHFLFDFVQLSEYDLYLLKWIAADIHWCMPDASGNDTTIWLSISYIGSKTKILVENHLNRGKMGCFRSHIFSCLLIITVFLSPSCPPVRLRGTKLCPQTYFGHIQLKKLVKS